MPVKTLVGVKVSPEDPYGVEFNPETDVMLTEEEVYRTFGSQWQGRTDNHAMRTEYVGAVVGTYEKNFASDSDFVAVVEVEPGAFRHVEYASTRGWTYANSATVDATPEVVERYHQWREATFDRLAAERKEAQGKVAEVGKTVTVTGGRKHKGKSGVVGWVGESRYGKRMRVDTESGEQFFVDISQTDLPYLTNPMENVIYMMAEQFRGCPQSRDSEFRAS